MSARLLDPITYDWGCRAFTEEHMRDPNVRAIRCAEEVLEACQVIGVPPEQMHKLIDYVNSRKRGELSQEIGGVIVTSRMLVKACGPGVHFTTPEDLYLQEIRRVLAKTPEHFRERNEEKLKLGFTGH
jgi:hypothetical protein